MTSREAEIQARLDAATPGPWRAVPDREGRLYAIDSDSDYITLHNTAPRQDAELIANAPTDLAYLLARVATLEARVAAVREAAESMKSGGYAASVYESAAEVGDMFLDALDSAATS